ncbi:hypothetical protein PBRA_002664 [Plasmodiophora brassicae]|uniref:EF-hand domain-containing protein n=1 Tax=Plasmodiophora brassicae TaxID=37360 RepID=A0A0G4J5C0_PLABS|nr:hypothetical protein PBRA_002664 [Plasmodiophora brassicae]
MVVDRTKQAGEMAADAVSAKRGLSDMEIAELDEIFSLVDKSHAGFITPDVFTELLLMLGVETTLEEVDAMIKEIDKNSDGRVEFAEFVAVMSRKLSDYYTADQVKNAFKVFSHSQRPGCIRRSDLISALTSYGADMLTRNQATDLLQEVDPVNAKTMA